jgi:2-polyprenyl-3-methyl-5-hydroxy-6-metoxy-1,4-benzoquinol methylase
MKHMTAQRRDFDKLAASWDENPARVELANDLFTTIASRVPLTPQMDVLDYGCGTGLVSLQIAPSVRSLTGADGSREMLHACDAKATQLGLANVILHHLEDGAADGLERSYGMIVSTMTLHHIEEPALLLQRFAQLLVPGGWLCLADLDPDGGKFHEDSTGVFHNGFDRDALRTTLAKAGFGEIEVSTAAEVRGFSVFLFTARTADQTRP